MRKLRRKLGGYQNKPAWILNEPGLGYRLPKPGDPPQGRRERIFRVMAANRAGTAEPTAALAPLPDGPTRNDCTGWVSGDLIPNLSSPVS